VSSAPLTNTAALLVRAWQPGLVIPLVCLVALAGYGIHFRRLLSARAVFFVLAVGVFFVALASPIGVLADGYLFSAHMLQHLLLMLVVPPLVYLGLPRVCAAAVGDEPPRALAAPLSWAAGVGAMWLWHAPTLCNAAATSTPVRAVQTVTLVMMGLAFWRPILDPAVSRRLPVFPALLYLFAACVACTLLGIVVTLSPVEVCSAYLHPVDTLGVLPLVRDGWGMSRQADQQIGGLLMWVPACFLYGAAMLATLARYYAEEPEAR
jgi:putative membrane protein